MDNSMASAQYNSTSFGWQVRQVLRRFSEWAEYQANQVDVDLPDWNWPDWDLAGLGTWIFWLGAGAIALWIAWLLYKALEPTIRQWLAQEQDWVRLGDHTPTATETDRSTQYWWQQAQEQAQQGNYGEACRALYRATLQHLHDSQKLLHDPSRTDGEYLNRLSDDQPLPRPYQLLIGTHERLTFGSAIASAEMFKRCRRAYEEIQKP